MLDNLEDNILYIIYNKVNFKCILNLKKITLYNNNTIKKYPRYCNAIQIMSSNYIKYWWLNLKFKKNFIYNKYTLCSIKNDDLYSDYILVYSSNMNLNNSRYNYICKKYIKSYKKNCIVSCYRNILKKKNYENIYKNYDKYIRIILHPYTKLNPSNIIFENCDGYYFSKNELSFNVLKLKNILFYNYKF